MKTITKRLPIKFASFLILLMIQAVMYGQQVKVSNQVLETTGTVSDGDTVINTASCTANDIRVVEFKIIGANNTVLNPQCTPGDIQQATIVGVMAGNTAASRYSLKIIYDLYVNDVYQETKNLCRYSLQAIPANATFTIQNIDWSCGDRIELKNFYMAWQSTSNADCAPNTAKCFYSALGFRANGPLIANYSYVNPCNSLQANFTDKSSGGAYEGGYTYLWNFGDGVIPSTSTLQNPSFTYTAAGTYNVTLTVKDSLGIVDSQTYPVTVYAPIANIKVAKTAVDCTGNNTGKLVVSGVTGGDGNYTYSISPQPASMVQNNNEFSNLPAGAYTITVKDGRNCTASIPVTLTVNDTTAPTITAPSNKVVEGCNTGGIKNGGKTNLTYSTTSVVITATQFQAEGGSFVEANVKSISYKDTSTGTCPTIVTRTFTITDQCDKSASATQTINIDDTTKPTFTAPADKIISCEESTAPSNTGDVTDEYDACATGLEATYTDVVTAGACANESVINRTWTLKDNCNNSISKIQKITVQDKKGPTFTVPADKTVSCEDTSVAAAGNVSNASDNCGSVASTTHNDVITPGNCAGNYTIKRTFTLTDDCGNKTEKTQTITVEDKKGPTFTVPADKTVSCEDTSVAAAGNVSNASDNCGSVASTTHNDVITPGNCAGNYTIKRTFTLTDDCGNKTEKTQTITVEDKQGPTFTVPADKTVSCEDTSVAAAGNVSNASDNCGSVASTTHNDVITPGNCAGNYTIKRTFTLTDDCGNKSEKTQTITVIDDKGPSFDKPADITVSCEDTSVAAAGNVSNASDNCGSVASTTHNDVITPGNCAGNYTIKRTFTLTDDCGNKTEKTQTITVEDKQGPTFTVPADKTVSCEDTSVAAAGNVSNASDNCGSVASTTHNDVITPGNCAGNYTIKRTFTLTDDCGNKTEKTQTITVEDKQGPTFTVPADKTVSCEDTSVAAAGNVSNASDNCGSVASTTHNDVITTGNCAGNYIIKRTFTLTDDCGNKTEKTQTITVEDKQGPTFTVPADKTVSCEDTSVAAAGNVSNASDNCGSVASTTHNDVITPGNCAGNYTIKRTFTLTDDCGNKTEKTQTITVEDKTNPIITKEATDVDITCTGDGNDGEIEAWLNNNGGATATDNCGNVTWSNNYGSADADCSNAITVIFTASDSCGNKATTSATYKISDNDKPNIDKEASNKTVECDGNGNISELNAFLTSQGGAIASDTCSAISWSHNYTTLSDDCGGTGSALITFTATDACGNTATTSATFTIEDNTAPSFEAPVEITISCDQDDQDLDITGRPSGETDNCSEILKTEFVDVITQSDTCGGNYTITRTFTVTDDCGNSTSKDQIINVEDTTPPTFTIPADITIECDEDINDLDITGRPSDEKDNCSAILKTEFKDESETGTCPTLRIVTRTFTVSDECGNKATGTQIITVQDTTKPTITNEATNIDITCSTSGNDNQIEEWLNSNGGATATDNCTESTDLTWTNNYGSAAADCSNAIEVIFTVTDSCGNSISTTATYMISDNDKPVIDVEASNKTVECDGSGNIDDLNDFLATQGGASASDTCSTITWSNNYTSLSDDCGSTGSATVIFTATDACGNSESTSATFTIQDSTPPSFSVPEDITISCEEDNQDLTLTGNISNEMDNCSTTFSSSFTDEITQSETCSGSYTITRTFTVTDECDNSFSQKQTITVEDKTPPSFTVPESITIECDQDTEDLEITGNVTLVSDNCSLESNITVEFSDAILIGDCAGERSITRTFTLTDECGNVSTATQSITVVDTTPPTIGTPASSVILECSSVQNEGGLEAWLESNGGASASDNCTDENEITWTNTYGGGATDCTNAVEVTFTATDECGNSSSTTATYSVQDINPPTITGDTDDFTVECDGSGNKSDLDAFLNSNGGATASDDCSAVVWSNNYTGLSDLCGKTGAADITFTATDGCGNSASITRTFQIVDTTPPTITDAESMSRECNPGTQAVLDAWLANNGRASASDSCSDVVWSMETNGMSTACAETGSMTVIFTATDACGNAASTTATFQIIDTTAPQFTVPRSATIECDQDPNDLSLTGDVTDERDNCSTDLDATYTDVVEDGVCPVITKITRTWTLMDSCENTNTQVQIIEIRDTTAPTFTVPESIVLECDDDVTNLILTGDVSDEDDNCSIDIEATYSDETSSGSCPGATVITRTWTLKDDCGNTNTQTQTITVSDTTPPTFSVPANVTIECGEDATDLVLTGNITDVEDNCSSNLETSFVDVESAGECPGVIKITRTWTVTDECGNSASLDQTITIEDNTAPVLEGELAESVSVTCATIPAVPSLVFTDACSSTVDVQFNEETSEPVDDQYVITREWTVSDDCDNTARFTQTINVDNSTTIVQAADLVQCTTDAPFDLLTKLGNGVPTGGTFEITSSTGGSGTINGSMVDPITFGIGDYEITYKVADDVNGCPIDYIINLNINKDCIVLPPPNCEDISLIDISQAVTPNGDNINDVLTVSGYSSECGFIVELTIFNRWGAKIYESNNYKNDWGAEASNASIGSANVVPTGTYYYIINLRNSGFAPFSGPIYVGTK